MCLGLHGLVCAGHFICHVHSQLQDKIHSKRAFAITCCSIQALAFRASEQLRLAIDSSVKQDLANFVSGVCANIGEAADAGDTKKIVYHP